MNYINNNGIQARQIVPEDFLFLSTADGQMVQAIICLIRSIYGIDTSNGSGDAVYLGKGAPTFARHNTGSTSLSLTWTLSIPAGCILYDGKMFELSGYSVDTTVQGLFYDYSSLRIGLSEVEEQPSPVFGPNDTITPSVSCHRARIAAVVQEADAEAYDMGLTLDQVKVLFPPSSETPVKTIRECLS